MIDKVRNRILDGHFAISHSLAGCNCSNQLFIASSTSGLQSSLYLKHVSMSWKESATLSFGRESLLLLEESGYLGNLFVLLKRQEALV